MCVFVLCRDDLRDKVRKGACSVFVTWCVAYVSPSLAMSLSCVMPPCSGADPTKCSVRILDAVKALAVLPW